MTVDLPPEILAEIFSLLPVKSVLRFRSTSNSLRSLIDSHNFINLHLRKSLNRSLILRLNTDLYQFDEDFSNLTTAVPLNHPFLRHSTNITLLGSCNGLLCISNGEIDFSNPYDKNEITFWNPNICKHRIIPFLPIPIPPRRSEPDDINFAYCVHGFGFDPLTSDYKLLRISWSFDQQLSTFDSHVRLFSSKNNSWKIIPRMPYALYYAQTMGVFVHNSLHWIMTKELDGLHPCLIVAFNLTLEIFNQVPLPAEIGQKNFEISVSGLGGCLCMVVDYQTSDVDVWVMKEYRSRDSWCKLFTLVKSCFTSSLKSLGVLGCSSDGRKVLLQGINDLKLFWYDLKSEQITYVEGIPNFDEAMFCVGSLVPPSFPVVNCKKENLCKLRCQTTSKRRDDFLSQGFKLRL